MRYTINGQEYEVVYLRLTNDTASVSVNDNVSAGHAFAAMNSTGGSTGDHLTIYKVNADGAKRILNLLLILKGELCAAN
jgi:murein DD-endopeptidase MepM/ murein hydrolase activator NlpD